MSDGDLFFCEAFGNILSVSCVGKGKLFVQLWFVRLGLAAVQCACLFARLFIYFCPMKYSENNLEQLITFFKSYCDIYHEFATETNEVKEDYNQQKNIARDFIIRHSVNAGALIQLLPFLKVNKAHKLPVHLILRTIISDVLISSALFTFVSNENNNEALENELNILRSQFIKAFLKIEEVEKKFAANNNLTMNIDVSEILRAKYASLFTGNKVKSVKELRTKESLKFFSSESEMDAFKWQQEEQKLSRFKHDDYVRAFAIFKYYSQYQHYSPLASEVLELEGIIDRDFSQMIVCACYMTTNTEVMFKVLMGNENKYIDDLFKILKALKGNLEK